MSAEELLDRRFAALPGLLRNATNQNISRDRVRRFMDELRQADETLFTAALLFLSRDGRGFVLVHESGGSLENPRHWLRWPLGRLFVTRHACIITNPVTGDQALAVPIGGLAERYVIVAPLSSRPLRPEQQIFLDVLQNVSIPSRVRAAGSERTPRFVWFGADEDLRKRLSSIASRRGWPLKIAPTFGHVLLALERDQADVALLDAAALKEPLNMLRALRHAAKIGDAPIVLFGAGDPGPEVRTLSDQCLPVAANDAQLVSALKSSAQLVSGMRRIALQSDLDRMDVELRRARDAHELAQACAEAALALGADIVSVMLVDKNGVVHSAHRPSEHVLGDRWPAAFVTGESIMQTRVEDTFFEEAFDDDEYAQRIREIEPVSAAVMPIGEGTQIVGTLVALSTRRSLFEPEFEAFTELCERTARVLPTLREPASGATPWREMTAAESILELYQGPKASASIYAACAGEVAAIVALDSGEKRQAARIATALLADPDADLEAKLHEEQGDLGGLLLAIVRDGRLEYACKGFPVPLRIPLSGPVPAFRIAERCETGTIDLHPPCMTLLYSMDFALQVETAQLVAAVQREMRNSRTNIARMLPELAEKRQRLTFASIMMRTSAADAQRHPAFR